MSDALFLCDQDRYIPTNRSLGPWSLEYLHGGPVVGLMAHAMQNALGPTDLRLARLTVDLLRPVPQQPLTVATRTIRPGRRLQLLEARLLADDTEVSHASALYLEQALVDVPSRGRFQGNGLQPPVDETANSLSEASGWGSRYTPEGFHTTAQAVVLDGVQGDGYGCVWMRLPLPLVHGAQTSPSVMAATLCDFGNGVGQLNLGRNRGCINADVTLYLHRPPIGKWLGLEAHSHMETNGMGLVETTLFDAQGPIGRVLQGTIATSMPGRR
ncbi:thioesterase family protein [Aquisalimonas sp.]|uniref:thioesterase family protein n=1 Tax=Aquisalimonas sp. TaxID=1872621 RepID=UPI0025B847BF|nr:thioesterase family protein [Aquisalimonas sp.]